MLNIWNSRNVAYTAPKVRVVNVARHKIPYLGEDVLSYSAHYLAAIKDVSFFEASGIATPISGDKTLTEQL